jgi:hypothetical protein
MNGDYFLLRSLPKVRGEAALLFLAYNIKRASNVLGFKDIMAKLDACLINPVRFILFFRSFFFLPYKYNAFLSG